MVETDATYGHPYSAAQCSWFPTSRDPNPVCRHDSPPATSHWLYLVVPGLWDSPNGPLVEFCVACASTVLHKDHQVRRRTDTQLN